MSILSVRQTDLEVIHY